MQSVLEWSIVDAGKNDLTPLTVARPCLTMIKTAQATQRHRNFLGGDKWQLACLLTHFFIGPQDFDAFLDFPVSAPMFEAFFSFQTFFNALLPKIPASTQLLRISLAFLR